MVFKTDFSLNNINAGQKNCRMLPWEHSAMLSTFIKLPFVIKIFVLSIFKWPLETGFTVSFDLQDRTTKDGLSRITKYFEQAGGALRYLHNHFSHAPSMDMQPQTLTMLVQLMMVRLFFSSKCSFVFHSKISSLQFLQSFVQ